MVEIDDPCGRHCSTYFTGLKPQTRFHGSRALVLANRVPQVLKVTQFLSKGPDFGTGENEVRNRSWKSYLLARRFL